MPNKPIQRYIVKFWDLHLKAMIYKWIEVAEKKQQFCMSFLKEIRQHVNSQSTKTILSTIYHNIVASQIYFQQGGKKNGLFKKVKENGRSKEKTSSEANASKTPKAKEKGFKGKVRLSQEDMECYKKEKKCFKYGQEGHVSRVCPNQNERNDTPRVTVVQNLKEDDHSKGSQLSYAWGKIREHDDLMLFDPRST